MNDSYIKVSSAGTIFAGADATQLYRAITVRSMLKGMRLGLKFRNMTQTKAMRVASDFTGHLYKRGQLALAEQHLCVWIETMKSALPIEKE